MILASQEEGKMEGLGSTDSIPPSKFTNKNQLLKLGDCDWYIHITVSKIDNKDLLYSTGNSTQCSVLFSSVAQSSPTLCNPMDCSTPGLPVHHQLPEFTQTHVHWVSDAIQPSHPLSSPSPPAFDLSQYQGLFKWVSSLHPVAKVLEFQLQHQSFQWIFRTYLLQDGLIDLLAVQGTLKSLLQHHSSKASILWYPILWGIFIWLLRNKMNETDIDGVGTKVLIQHYKHQRDLLAVQGTLKSLLQYHSLKASIPQHSAFFIVQLTSTHDYWKNHSLD